MRFYGVILLANSVDRYASVQAIDTDGKIIYASDGNRVHFEFSVSMDERANECTIRVYNVTDHEIYSVLHGAKYISLIAGDADNYGEVFRGELIDGFQAQSDTEQYLQISVVDGDSFYTAFINQSVVSGETIGGIVEKCVKRCSSPCDVGFITPDAYAAKLARGAALFGSPVNICKSAARALNAAFYVFKGRIYIVSANDPVSDKHIVIDESSGLIGVPSVDNWYAFFRHEINSWLIPGKIIEIQTDMIRTNYRIVSVFCSGDTDAGDWYMNVMAIGQSGDNINITAVSKNIWR